MKRKFIIFAAALALLPRSASADMLELSQSQMRQLVLQQQVLSAETVVSGAAQNFGGVVMDIRGFLSDGQMTYRLLLQRADGQVVEVLVNGVDGQQVSHDTDLGQVVSAVARATNPASNASSNANSNGQSANANRSNNGNSSAKANASSGNNGNSGNSRSRGNSGNGNGKNS